MTRAHSSTSCFVDLVLCVHVLVVVVGDMPLADNSGRSLPSHILLLCMLIH